MRRVTSLAALLLLLLACMSSAHAYVPLYVHPEDRVAGNRRPEAIQLASALLMQMWPVSVQQVRIDGVGQHRVAGIVLSGVKFHQALNTEGFLDEVESLISKTFAAVDVEEVDVWVLVPVPVAKGAVVSGDLAVPTSRTVFACSVPQSRLGQLDELLRSKKNVYWEDRFASRLRTSAK